MAAPCLCRGKHSHVRHFKLSKETGELSLCVAGGFTSHHVSGEPRAGSRAVLSCSFFQFLISLGDSRMKHSYPRRINTLKPVEKPNAKPLPV